MTNTMSGPYSKTTWTDAVTMGTHVNMGNLETQSQVALGSINPDLVTSGFVLNGGTPTRHNAYKPAVLADGPLRYYRLDETSGTIANDSSGSISPLNANIVASPTLNVAGLLAGDADTCYTFAAASSQYVFSIGTGLNTGTNSPVTIECWFKFAANPASTQAIMCVGDRGTAGKFLALVLTATGTVQASNGTLAVTSAVLTTGVAHHLVAVFDGTTLHLYVDGAQVGTGTAASLTLAYVGGNAFVIAAYTSGTGPISPASFFSGQVDEVCYYSGALSGTRILAHYTAGSTATTQVDIASGKAYITQADGTQALCTIGATTQTTVTINSTYHLYLQPDGTWYWSTSNTPAANSLAFATVTTDGSGNATLVTDLRVTTIPLLQTAAGSLDVPTLAAPVITSPTFPAGLPSVGGQASTGSFGVPVIVAQAVAVHVTTTTVQNIINYSLPATGLYRVSLTARLLGANPSVISAYVLYTEAISGGAEDVYFTHQGNVPGGASPIVLHSASLATPNTIAAYSVVVYASGAIIADYQDTTATPNDFVTAIIERLT